MLAAAADRDDVAAVVSLTPLVDGRAAGLLALKHHPPSRDPPLDRRRLPQPGLLAAGREPVLMPIVARPGELGALTLSGHYESYLAIAGPTWRNEIDASVGLELGSHRPARHAKHCAARCSCRSPTSTAAPRRRRPPRRPSAARAEVRHYPCDHFDVWPGSDWFDPVLAHQLMFLRRHLAVG